MFIFNRHEKQLPRLDLDMLRNQEPFLHNLFCRLWVQQCMKDNLISKQLIHLLERLARRFREEEHVAKRSADIEHENCLKEPESDIAGRDRRDLCKDKIQTPIVER
jgi:hypothetical protein